MVFVKECSRKLMISLHDLHIALHFAAVAGRRLQAHYDVEEFEIEAQHWSSMRSADVKASELSACGRWTSEFRPRHWYTYESYMNISCVVISALTVFGDLTECPALAFDFLWYEDPKPLNPKSPKNPKSPQNTKNPKNPKSEELQATRNNRFPSPPDRRLHEQHLKKMDAGQGLGV